MSDAVPIKQDPLLAPLRLGSLVLRNRIMSTSHAPAYVENGLPTDRYRLYHEEKAMGGLALTMIGGSSNVSPDSPSAFGQIYAGDDDVLPWFEKLTAGVKSHGAAIMCQLTHMGRRTASDVADWLPVIAPSNLRERAHRSYPKVMEPGDFRRVAKDFAAAARRCRDGGFDGIELLTHGHLLGQVLSPATNQRTDAYGGTLQNRLRLVLEVLADVRSQVGADILVGMRITGDELAVCGLSLDDCVEIVQRLEGTGYVDFFNVLAGNPYDDLGLADWVSPMGNPAAPHLGIVKRIRQSVSLPVFHAGGIADLATARHALREGIVDMVGMTRAHIADPWLVTKLQAGQEERIRVCVGMNYCVDRVNQGKDALCGQNPATGREGILRHRIGRNPEQLPGKAVVVGGGPGGMEAARVLAERGHRVVLFEASGALGGQNLMAAAGTTRKQMFGVSDWLAREIGHLGVDVRFNTLAESDDVLAENPDIVVVATGGLPRELAIGGGQHSAPIWDVFGSRDLRGDVLIFDDRGDHHAAVAAEVATSRGARVVIATPDRTPLFELGPTNYAVAMRNLYQIGTEFRADTDLVAIGKLEKRLIAQLRNTLTGEMESVIFDRIFHEAGTDANDSLFFDLCPSSANGGQLDVTSVAKARPTYPTKNPDGDFVLIRIGDAVSSRNIHAALHDAIRICSDIRFPVHQRPAKKMQATRPTN
ncbi:MAG: FAD-dependent oxidoreductase [Burkholderiaceae bacterium]